MKTKLVRMDLTVRVPSDISAAEARREVRTLINMQCNWYLAYGDVTVAKVRPVARVRNDA